MRSDRVVFISITDYDNLGVGYMEAMLSAEGFETKVIDPRRNRSYILKTLREFDPVLIGFSIIFLNHIDLFTQLAEYLRKSGIKSHFTAGGHYASLNFGQLFNLMPGLDSIVRFEGEYTLLQLAKAAKSTAEWKNIEGVVFYEDGNIHVNPLHPVETELDKFPFPCRAPLKEYAFKKRFATIIAGRGCRYDCSFCNTREFYKMASGPVKRLRKPGMVVREMEYLFKEKKCSVFIFHDDDFPLKTKQESEWLKTFCNELSKNDLNKKLIWKINCRPDEVEEEKFALMKRNGLFLVFLGIEDGTDAGLYNLNKQVTVAKTVESIGILKKLEIGFDYGFMLFQPDTEYKSLYENLDFLREMCGDGYTPVTFLKLLPLYGTRVEKELLMSGRLKGSYGREDYDFNQESMNKYYDFITENFNKWMRSRDGVENLSKWARNYFLVYKHYFDPDPEGIRYSLRIEKIISESNLFMLDTMKELAMIFESGQFPEDKNQVFESYRGIIESKHEYLRKKIMRTMTRFLSLVDEKHCKPVIF